MDSSFIVLPFIVVSSCFISFIRNSGQGLGESAYKLAGGLVGWSWSWAGRGRGLVVVKGESQPTNGT